MLQNTKRIALLLFVGSLVSLILLSASLSNLQLHAGTPFPSAGDSGSEIQFFANPPLANTYSFTILKGVFALVFLILMIYVPLRLFTLITLRRLFQLLLILVALLSIVIVISFIPINSSTYRSGDSSEITNPPSFASPVSPLGMPPQGLIQFILIAFMFGMGLIIFKIFKLWLYPVRIKGQLLQEAETAVDAIKGGADFRNVILNCYLQMTNLLKEERGIERSYNMTAREFEDWLESKGFPIVPVRQLTHLFENVRYGTPSTVTDDEKMAVESLNAIIQFCRNGGN